MDSQMDTKARQIPDQLQDVALVDVDTAAAVGGMKRSWWHAEVAAGRAPQPVIKQPRCTRWRLLDVRTFWAQRASNLDAAKAEQVTAITKRASAAAKAKRVEGAL
jgi:predicted DNA-binding transcriptional regulator AlpA